jgi:hypothetical protein
LGEENSRWAIGAALADRDLQISRGETGPAWAKVCAVPTDSCALWVYRLQAQVLLGKVTYSEELSRYSPGFIAILAATKELLISGHVLFVASAADANHPFESPNDGQHMA